MKSCFLKSLVSCCERALYGPSSVESGKDCVVSKTNPFCPLTSSKRFPVVGNPLVHSFVDTLFLIASPFAVFWRVSFGVVDSFNGTSFRPWTHIRNKVLNVIPSFADRYSSTPVIAPPLAFRVFASLMHGSPNAINWAFGKPVNRDGFFNGFKPVTSAASSCAEPKRICLGRAFLSAIASTIPVFVSVLVLATKPEHGKPSKFQSSEVLESSLDWLPRKCNLLFSVVHKCSMYCVSTALRLQPLVVRYLSHRNYNLSTSI